MKNELIVVVYVDDCLIFAKDGRKIDEFIESMKKAKFRMTDEDGIENFLGISIKKVEDGYILTQTGLIDRALQACGIENESKLHEMPAKSRMLTKDMNGPNRESSWSYRKLIGILTYLANTSRPDISFATHQCARFSACPKLIHEIAVKRIVRYLKGTRDQGYKIASKLEKKVDCYVDADFCGMWNNADDDGEDSTICRSRTGFVILFAGSPLLWSSKLQTETALSTTEAEYIALSQAMREIIPLQRLMAEMADFVRFDLKETIAHSTVFEDNKGCIELANSPKMRPRTRHIAIKYHHFRDHVRQGKVRIEHVASEDQLADIFTKPLPLATFSRLRNSLMGW